MYDWSPLNASIFCEHITTTKGCDLYLIPLNYDYQEDNEKQLATQSPHKETNLQPNL